MKLRIFAAVLIAATAILATPVFAGPKGYSNATLSGTYAGSIHGYVWVTDSQNNSYKEDIGTTDIITYDGKGNFTSLETLTGEITSGAFPGFVCTFSESGTYTVNSDGTATASGTETITNSGPCPSANFTSSAAVSPTGNTLFVNVTSVTLPPGSGTVDSVVETGVLTKQ